jgi:hypothetical protein
MFFFLKKKFQIFCCNKNFFGRGMSLAEALIGVGVFALVAIGIYQAYAGIYSFIKLAQNKLTAISLANEQFEIIRNLSYSNVGIQGGLPSGSIPYTRVVNRGGIDFTLKTTIRNIDDPFDGVLGGVPNDLSPADYKLAEVEINCALCKNFTPSFFTTTIGPKGLETTSTNGALFVKVFDSAGLPISGASVRVENNSVIPNILIQDITNNSGVLQIVDAPPGNETYQIFVSKNGYSSDQTYPTGGASNPNPVKPNANVSVQQVTQTSFAIDKVSTMNVSTVTQNCSYVPNVPFSISGSKLIGTSPDVKKYSANLTTGGSGVKTVSNLEWDTYDMNVNSGGSYDLIGVNPAFPLNVLPNATHNVQIVLAPVDPISRVVSVVDGATGLPLSGASVRLFNSGIGFDSTLITGRGFLRQDDWVGGAGQSDFSMGEDKFFESTDIDYTNFPGEIALLPAGLLNGSLTSSTFDTGSPSNFYELNWNPKTQPVETGVDSIKFQIATNNDNATWDFKGPDGTASTFYTISDANIHSSNNGNRYLRYKAFLSTTVATSTPTLSDLSFTFTSDCVSPGQVRFSALSSNSYTIEVSKTGYQTETKNINVTGFGVDNIVLNTI